MQKEFSEQLHVMLVVRALPSERYPLNGIFEMDQARALRDLGIKVSVLSFDLRSIRRRRRFGFSYVREEGIDVFSASIPLGRVSKNMMSRFGVRAAKRLMHEAVNVAGMPDVLHAHFAQYGDIGLWIKSRYGIPLVYTEHCSLVDKGDERYVSLAKKSWVGADAVIAVSSSLAANMSKHCECSPIVIGNIVETSFGEMPLASRNGSLRFVSVGSLIPRKGHDVLIDAFSGLPGNATLSIFGEGAERPRLQAQIDSLGLTNRVALRGQCSREDIARAFRESDCFVLASRSETFGVAYIEAMAAGLPVVATKCGGPEDFVTERCGRIVEMDDSQALASAMLDVGSSNSFSSAVIREYVLHRFSSNAIGASLLRVYESVAR